MNILVAVAWMWMAAQTGNITARTVNFADLHGNPFVTEIACVTKYSDGHVDYEPCSAAPPAEHVIEIRTKRWLNGKAKSCDWVTTDGNAHCREIRYDGHCPAGTSCAEEYDYRREIWIDGKKWGVLKESGQ